MLRFSAHSLNQQWPNQSNDGLVVYFQYLFMKCSIHVAFPNLLFLHFYAFDFLRCGMYSMFLRLHNKFGLTSIHVYSVFFPFRCEYCGLGIEIRFLHIGFSATGSNASLQNAFSGGVIQVAFINTLLTIYTQKCRFQPDDNNLNIFHTEWKA